MRITFLSVLSLIWLQCIHAQPASYSSTREVEQADSLFWNAYNHCDIATMRTYFSQDVEFYHDKGGVTHGVDALITSFAKGPCSKPDSFVMRREVVATTAKIHMLYQAGAVYGAIITGDHIFYVRTTEEKERPGSEASFTTLWLLENGTWKMKRVFSYDHRQAPYSTAETVVPVSAAILKQYAGKYQGRKMGALVVQPAKGSLIIVSGNTRIVAYPSSQTLFFSRERDLTLQFAKKGAGIIDVIVREKGVIVETYTAAKR